jgi:glycopeptide antibiotics resistance protein
MRCSVCVYVCVCVCVCFVALCCSQEGKNWVLRNRVRADKELNVQSISVMQTGCKTGSGGEPVVEFVQ